MGKSNAQMSLLYDEKDQRNYIHGNTKLVDYGLQNEESDYRAHVGYKTQHVFVFPTKPTQHLLQEIERTSKYKAVPVFSYSAHGETIQTARGYPIPLSDLPSLQEILIPIDLYRKYEISPKDPTKISGQKAVLIVFEMIRRHLVLLPLEVQEVVSKSLQIKGQDIVISMNCRMQVKCDFRAGRKERGGTGNVFLQTAECNPFRSF